MGLSDPGELAPAPDAVGIPLHAADLIARGIGKGPALDAAVRLAQEAWITAGFRHHGAALSAIIASIEQTGHSK